MYLGLQFPPACSVISSVFRWHLTRQGFMDHPPPPPKILPHIPLHPSYLRFPSLQASLAVPLYHDWLFLSPAPLQSHNRELSVLTTESLAPSYARVLGCGQITKHCSLPCLPRLTFQVKHAHFHPSGSQSPNSLTTPALLVQFLSPNSLLPTLFPVTMRFRQKNC